MYKTKTQNFLVTENIGLTVVKEICTEKGYYVLFKIGILGKSTYGICILGDEYALETVCEDADVATDMFDTVIKQEVSPCHLFDVVNDFRHSQIF